MLVQLDRRDFTVEEYHLLGDAGYLGEDARVELIEGEIVAMSPIKGAHMLGVNRFNHAFMEVPGRTWIVSVQNPIRLFGDSEPQPDLALLRPEADRDAVPEAADVYLVVEVADTTLTYDRGRKRRLYARAGIPEYWIMDINGRRILRYSEPERGEYRRMDEFAPGDTIASLVLPAIRLSVAALFA